MSMNRTVTHARVAHRRLMKPHRLTGQPGPEAQHAHPRGQDRSKSPPRDPPGSGDGRRAPAPEAPHRRPRHILSQRISSTLAGHVLAGADVGHMGYAHVFRVAPA